MIFYNNNINSKAVQLLQMLSIEFGEETVHCEVLLLIGSNTNYIEFTLSSACGNSLRKRKNC